MRFDEFKLFNSSRESLGTGVFLYFYANPQEQVLQKTLLDFQQLHSDLVLVSYVVKEKQKSTPSRIFWKAPGSPNLSGYNIFTQENGRFLKVEFEGVLNPGVFSDQEGNRIFLESWIRKNLPSAQDKRALNLFSYTGAFSVLATSLGMQATSVDLSGRYLDWEKENQAMNGTLQLSRRLKASATDFVRRLEKKEPATSAAPFDVIIVDPPTFSRDDKGKVFRVQTDLPSLVGQILRHQYAVLPTPSPKLLLVSCNDESWDPLDFIETLRSQAEDIDDSLQVQAGFPAPGDRADSALRSAFILSQP